MDGTSRSIVEMYKRGVSKKGISKQLGVSEHKIRKILTNYGVATNEIGSKILALSEEGKSLEEIASRLGVARSTVCSYLPYTKGVYNADNPSENALRIRASRRRKK